MNAARILIAGIGNIFLGDDAFGAEVAQRLMCRPQPEGVRVFDFGIRGLDLYYTLLDGWDVVILIDAMPYNQLPGTLFLVEPQVGLGDQTPCLALEAHSMDPVQVLRASVAMGARLNKVLLVGCEPGRSLSEHEMAMGLSPPVAAALEPAVEMIESLVARVLREEYQFTHQSTGPAPEPAISQRE